MSTRTKKETTKNTASVKVLNVGDVVTNIGNLQTEIVGMLSGVSGKITEKLELLKNTETAIDALSTRLNELYEIEKESQQLDAVREDAAIKKDSFKKELEKLEQNYKERTVELEKQLKRFSEENKYVEELRRKKFEDEFNASVEAKKREELFRADELIRSWNEREKNLQAQETEVNLMKEKVAKLDEQTKAEVAKVTAIIKNEMKNHYEHQIALLEKDRAIERTAYDSQEKASKDQISQLQYQIAELNKQLVAARAEAKEVTTAALNSASKAQVADALQRVVDSKDKSNNK